MSAVVEGLLLRVDAAVFRLSSGEFAAVFDLDALTAEITEAAPGLSDAERLQVSGRLARATAVVQESMQTLDRRILELRKGQRAALRYVVTAGAAP